MTATVPTYVLLGVLTIGVAFVTLYVLTSNKISQRKAQLTTLQAELAQAQAQSERLSNYSQFAKLAQTRADTVRGLAAGRFDWHEALVDLSKVVPADTSLQTLNGSTTGTPGSSNASAATASADGSSGPAVELAGCTKSQDDVARLMSRLRLINGVTSVTLASSQKPTTGQGGGAVSVPTVSGAGSAVGCGPNAPTFDVKVLFQPLPGSGSGPQTATPGSSTAGGSK
jgi:Tfp pilus assembly protein PilN